VTTIVQPVVRSLLVGAVCVGLASPCAAADTHAGTPAPDPFAGKAAYAQHCARCHGVTGAGDGRDAARLYPKPRNFTEGVYKFRATPSGTPPTDEDLFHTLTAGLPGSGMPDWAHLDESVRWQLVAYVKSLSPTFQDTPPQPIALGEDPGPKRADFAKGKQVYEQLGCAACHGPQGRANGSSAKTLVDNWGRPIRPANLTEGWNYRGGSDPKAIVTRVLAGMDGTPMPSYAEAASPDDVWQMAYYVQSLQRRPHWSMIVHALPLTGALPDTVEDPRWEPAEAADVRMRNVVQPSGELTGAQSITTVTLQAVYNAEAVGFRVSWTDPSEERTEPADALALAFHPVTVRGDVVTLQTWPMRDSPALDVVGWSAQRQQAVEAVAKNYESVWQAGPSSVTRSLQARYQDGQWDVVVTRPLHPADVEGAAQLSAGQFVPLAFALWDGGNPEQRAVSSWIDVVLQHPPVKAAAPDPSLMAVWVLAALVLIVGLVLVFRRS